MQKGLWKHLHSKCLPVWALKNLLDVERGFRQMSWFSCEYWLSLIGVHLLVHLADMAKCTTGAVVWWIITIYMFIFGPFLYWDGFLFALSFPLTLFCKNSLDCRAASKGSCLRFQTVPFILHFKWNWWEETFGVYVYVLCATCDDSKGPASVINTGETASILWSQGWGRLDSQAACVVYSSCLL